MWMRAEHAELDLPTLRDFIGKNPLGMLITSLPVTCSAFPNIQVTHTPWLFDLADEQGEKVERQSDEKAKKQGGAGLGRLRGHIARQNPQAKALIEIADRQREQRAIGSSDASVVLEQEVSVVFNGPSHSYVPTHFYVATKPTTHKTAPTWNYTAVQAWGRLRLLFDASSQETSDYLQKQIEDLSRHAEENIMGHVRKSEATVEDDDRVIAWEVADAPAKFVDMLKKAIVGVEIDVTRLEGKFKMSQEMGKGDRQGVIEGFRRLGTDNALEISRTVEGRGAKRDAELAAKAALRAERSFSQV